MILRLFCPTVVILCGRWCVFAERSGQLEMYAASGSQRLHSDLSALPDTWSEVIIEGIPVTGGIAEVGFLADGEGGACCLVDDVRFVRE